MVFILIFSRGTKGIIMDMFRQPDKLLEAMEAITPLMINMGVAVSQQTGNPLIFIPLHKGADGFMSDEHRSVHHFVVRELPRAGRPLSPEFIAEKLGMAEDRVSSVLEALEKHMTFLFRNGKGEVVWAYPVTVEKTPHHITFNTGEEVYAA